MFGSGRFTGFSFIGEFKDDKFWNGSEFDQNFNLLATYLNGLRRPKQNNGFQKKSGSYLRQTE